MRWTIRWQNIRSEERSPFCFGATKLKSPLFPSTFSPGLSGQNRLIQFLDCSQQHRLHDGIESVPSARSAYRWAILITLAILGGLGGCFLGLVAVPLVTVAWQRSSGGWIFLAASILLILNALLATFLTSFSDPGIVPPFRRKGLTRSGGSESDVESESDLSPWGESGFLSQPPELWIPGINGPVPYRLRFCTTCGIYRPPRCSHCRITGHCIMRYDHNCPWVGQTIGRGNYRSFLWLLVSFSVLLVWAVAWSFATLRAIASHRGYSYGDAIQDYPQCIVIPVLCLMVGWFPLFLLGFHLYLIAAGLTTYERYRLSHHVHHADRKHFLKNNPFNRGPLLNFLSVLFPHDFAASEDLALIEWEERTGMTLEELNYGAHRILQGHASQVTSSTLQLGVPSNAPVRVQGHRPTTMPVGHAAGSPFASAAVAGSAQGVNLFGARVPVPISERLAQTSMTRMPNHEPSLRVNTQRRPHPDHPDAGTGNESSAFRATPAPASALQSFEEIEGLLGAREGTEEGTHPPLAPLRLDVPPSDVEAVSLAVSASSLAPRPPAPVPPTPTSVALAAPDNEGAFSFHSASATPLPSATYAYAVPLLARASLPAPQTTAFDHPPAGPPPHAPPSQEPPSAATGTRGDRAAALLPLPGPCAAFLIGGPATSSVVLPDPEYSDSPEASRSHSRPRSDRDVFSTPVASGHSTTASQSPMGVGSASDRGTSSRTRTPLPTAPTIPCLSLPFSTASSPKASATPKPLPMSLLGYFSPQSSLAGSAASPSQISQRTSPSLHGSSPDPGRTSTTVMGGGDASGASRTPSALPAVAAVQTGTPTLDQGQGESQLVGPGSGYDLALPRMVVPLDLDPPGPPPAGSGEAPRDRHESDPREINPAGPSHNILAAGEGGGGAERKLRIFYAPAAVMEEEGKGDTGGKFKKVPPPSIRQVTFAPLQNL